MGGYDASPTQWVLGVLFWLALIPAAYFGLPALGVSFADSPDCGWTVQSLDGPGSSQSPVYLKCSPAEWREWREANH